jgi:hypothetical protein
MLAVNSDKEIDLKRAIDIPENRKSVPRATQKTPDLVAPITYWALSRRIVSRE